MIEQEKDENSATDASRDEPSPVVQAKILFGDSREIVIEHDGERYKLRITRRGKLILQK